jgi:hypothetical protein
VSIRKDAPEGAHVLDLSAARAARAEARAAAGEGNPFLKLTVGYVEVKAEVPLAAMDFFTASDLTKGISALVADPEDVQTLLDDGLSTEDVTAILKFIGGTDQGESPASPAS